MPIYEYQCESCGHRLDALQKISEALLTDCPECGRADLRKLVSAPRFRLKGSGWYETDFKQDNRRNLADGGEGAKAKAESGSGGGEAGGGTGGDGAAKSAGEGAKKSQDPAGKKPGAGSQAAAG